jgi:hypothetical protein
MSDVEIEFKTGDLVKRENLNIVFRVKGITEGREFTPDGWLIGSDGSAINPRYCVKYTGAESAIPDA